MSMRNSAKPRLAGVIGWPVAHSLSPRLHAFWLEGLGLEGYYAPLPVRPDCLKQALGGLAALGFCGINVTLPHKESILPYLDRVDPAAARIKAVNTVLVGNGGRLEGRNTDVYGLVANLAEAVPDWRDTTRSALVLGAGGAARAAVVAFLDAGLDRIHVANRTRSRGEALARSFRDPRICPAGWQDRSSLLKESELVVNTTTLGMAGSPPLDLNLSLLPSHGIVYDVVYRPLETALLKQARRRGLRAVDGLGMLIHQAVPAFEAFYGRRPEVDEATRAHLSEALSPC